MGSTFEAAKQLNTAQSSATKQTIQGRDFRFWGEVLPIYLGSLLVCTLILLSVQKGVVPGLAPVQDWIEPPLWLATLSVIILGATAFGVHRHSID